MKQGASNLDITPGGTGTFVFPATTDTVANLAGIFAYNSADKTGNGDATAQSWLEADKDILTVDAMAYKFEFFIYGTNGTTTVSKALDLSTVSSAVIDSIQYQSIGQNVASGTTGTAQSTAHVATAAATILLATGTTAWWLKATGIIRFNTGGTWTPKVKFSANPTGTVLFKKNSYAFLIPLSSYSTYVQGAWA